MTKSEQENGQTRCTPGWMIGLQDLILLQYSLTPSQQGSSASGLHERVKHDFLCSLGAAGDTQLEEGSSTFKRAVTK